MNKFYCSFTFILCLYGNANLASELDQVKVGSLICESDNSYNETVIVDLQNRLAAMKGTPKNPYPKDCRYVQNEPLVVKFQEYSGGSAVVTKDGKTLYTSKDNIVLGKRASAEEEARDKCLKKVLDRFCLGSITSELPEPDVKEGENFVYFDGDKRIFVKSANARVATVSIFYPNPSWLHYRILLDQLKEKYGPGINFDTFPDYAESDTSKETSIALRKGRALSVWNQTGWSIEYGWASSDWRILTYKHNQLSEVLDKDSAELL